MLSVFFVNFTHFREKMGRKKGNGDRGAGNEETGNEETGNRKGGFQLSETHLPTN